MTDTLRFNVCKELSLLEGVDAGEVFEWDVGMSEQDQARRSDRVVAVIPMAQESELRAEYAALSCVKMTLHSPPYPSSITLEPTPQNFVLNLLCNTEASNPEFKHTTALKPLLDGVPLQGAAFVRWLLRTVATTNQRGRWKRWMVLFVPN
ncbi:hypothetical protein EDB84DRAFT_1204897 [Lactarius hengduanensis]|nr:hypothetical protein EDB84DRAFT_1204897 [Lactarius hengduanensis]